MAGFQGANFPPFNPGGPLSRVAVGRVAFSFGLFDLFPHFLRPVRIPLVRKNKYEEPHGKAGNSEKFT
jgi:hypothetical protein